MSIAVACELYTKHLAPLLVEAQNNKVRRVTVSPYENASVYDIVYRNYNSFELLMKSMNMITMEKGEKDDSIIFTLALIE